MQDRDHSIFSFARHGPLIDQQVVAACNLTPVVRHGYRLGVPRGGVWSEVMNTDSAKYGGSGVVNGQAQGPNERAGVVAESVPWQGQPASLVLSLPPLGVLWLEPLQVP